MLDTGWELAQRSLVHEWKTSNIREIQLHQTRLQASGHYGLEPTSKVKNGGKMGDEAVNLDFLQTAKFLHLSLTTSSNFLVFNIKVLLEMF